MLQQIVKYIIVTLGARSLVSPKKKEKGNSQVIEVTGNGMNKIKCGV